MTFVSLRYGEADWDFLALTRDLGILVTDASEIDKLNDLDGYAALIVTCDDIVSLNNTSVHFASELGQPNQVFLSFDGDWC